MQEKHGASPDFPPKAQPKGEHELTQTPAVEEKANPCPREQKEQKRPLAHIKREEIAGDQTQKGETSVCQTATVGNTAPQTAKKVIQYSQSHAQEDAPEKLRPLPSYGNGHT